MWRRTCIVEISKYSAVFASSIVMEDWPSGVLPQGFPSKSTVVRRTRQ